MKKFKVHVRYSAHYSLDKHERGSFQYYSCTIIRNSKYEAVRFLFEKFNTMRVHYTPGNFTHIQEQYWLYQTILDSYSIVQTGEYK